MNTYLTIMLPISGIYFIVMVVILWAYIKAKRKYKKMIKDGFYFIWNRGSFLGVSPETAELMGLTAHLDTANSNIASQL
ncbi:hypothetical protein Zmor_002532 [Zophobas morio]|uniref:Uncharacterized protein n=1 Tax=Zophobas morio TaxID=2755281 RepID=A0AA38J5F0_9CUCU|nr:hypothetical protein Zmor_002532 [Zophobas morio]